MPSITLSSFISGLIHSRAEEERLHASDVEKIAPLGAASDKKAISTGARRAASRRNMDVRPAPGKSDLHLQAHIAGRTFVFSQDLVSLTIWRAFTKEYERRSEFICSALVTLSSTNLQTDVARSALTANLLKMWRFSLASTYTAIIVSADWHSQPWQTSSCFRRGAARR